MSLGGIRIYSDDPVTVGDVQRLDIVLPGERSAAFTAEVVWVETLPEGAPARYDVGLKFIDLDPAANALLADVLGPTQDETDETPEPPA